MPLKIALVQTPDRLVNQLQQNIKQSIEPPFQQASGSFVTTLTGCSTTPVSIVSWEVGVDGRMVTLVLPGLSGTSNTTAATFTGLPKLLWPGSKQNVLTIVQDNGTVQLGTLTVTTTGDLLLGVTANGSAFTASGQKGSSLTTVTYARGV